MIESLFAISLSLPFATAVWIATRSAPAPSDESVRRAALAGSAASLAFLIPLLSGLGAETPQVRLDGFAGVFAPLGAAIVMAAIAALPRDPNARGSYVAALGIQSSLLAALATADGATFLASWILAGFFLRALLPPAQSSSARRARLYVTFGFPAAGVALLPAASEAGGEAWVAIATSLAAGMVLPLLPFQRGYLEAGESVASPARALLVSASVLLSVTALLRFAGSGLDGLGHVFTVWAIASLVYAALTATLETRLERSITLVATGHAALAAAGIGTGDVTAISGAVLLVAATLASATLLLVTADSVAHGRATRGVRAGFAVTAALWIGLGPSPFIAGATPIVRALGANQLGAPAAAITALVVLHVALAARCIRALVAGAADRVSVVESRGRIESAIAIALLALLLALGWMPDLVPASLR